MDIENKIASLADEMQLFHTKELHTTGKEWFNALKVYGNISAGKKILDVGCGTGFLSLLLAQNGYEVIAIDNSPSMLAAAQQAAHTHKAEKKIHFLQESAECTPFADSSFDIIISRSASWMFHEPERVYREWFRLLRPCGVVLNFDSNYMLPFYDATLYEKFQADERLLIEKYGDFHDCYHDQEFVDAAMNLPLAGVRRPQWDEDICKSIRFATVSCFLNLDAALIDPFSAIRYRSIPLFLVKATV